MTSPFQNLPSAEALFVEGDEKKDGSESLFQNFLSKTRLKPHTFFEGYGSILDTFAENESAKVKTWSRIVVVHFLQKVGARKTTHHLRLYLCLTLQIIPTHHGAIFLICCLFLFHDSLTV
jgi:hypothetical protein